MCKTRPSEPSAGETRRGRRAVRPAGQVQLLGAGDIRAIAGRLGVRPTKRLGQNFVVEPGTARQIAALAGPLAASDVILEVGPGLGSLTLALLAAAVAGEAAPPGGAGLAAAGPGARIVAVEIDPVLARELPETIAGRAPSVASRVTVIHADALALCGPALGGPALAGPASAGPAAARSADEGPTAARPGLSGSGQPAGGLPAPGVPGSPPAGYQPTVLAANLPYNVAVPVVLHLLEAFVSIRHGVVMVQAEVADRMCAGPGSRVYGVPSAKLAWYATARPAGVVPRSVFWPAPNVDSKLVVFTRHGAPGAAAPGGPLGDETAPRADVFAVIDAAFGQRRKTLRAALAAWAGSPAAAESVLRAAAVDPGERGEALGIADFARIAAAGRRAGHGGGAAAGGGAAGGITATARNGTIRGS
jgi:16S rRNA (adenine1518-N6/adenine1519-N6)-dimethyltransferase